MQFTITHPQRLSKALAVSAYALFILCASADAGWPPPGVPSGVMPWELNRYRGYTEPRYTGPVTPSHSEMVNRTPYLYSLQVTRLPHKHEYEDRNSALLIAHLPDDAQIFVQDQPTTQTGTLRQFLSPALVPGSKYAYTVRVRWHENGQWVEQMSTFPIQAGESHCIDVLPHDSAAIANVVTANLAKLSPEDRKLAEDQRFCGVQNGIRLGSMGVPVKAMANGKPVFLCCSSCEDAVRKNPGEVLANVEKLKMKK